MWRKPSKSIDVIDVVLLFLSFTLNLFHPFEHVYVCGMDNTNVM